MHTAAANSRSRSQARSVETRAAILAAAGKAFAEAGLAGARTDAIAAAAGVNKALLYYYFKSKEDLYQAVLEDHIQEFNQTAIEVLNGPGSARSVLLRYVSLHFDFVASRMCYAPLYQQLMMAGGEPMQELIRKFITPRSEALDKLLERGTRNGEFRKADRMHSAFSLAALVVFYFSSAPVMKALGRTGAYGKASLKQRKQEVLDFIRYGLFSDPNAPLE